MLIQPDGLLWSPYNLQFNKYLTVSHSIQCSSCKFLFYFVVCLSPTNDSFPLMLKKGSYLFIICLFYFRQRKCNKCYIVLMDIRSMLENRTDAGGKLNNLYREIMLLLNTLE